MKRALIASSARMVRGRAVVFHRMHFQTRPTPAASLGLDSRYRQFTGWWTWALFTAPVRVSRLGGAAFGGGAAHAAHVPWR
jgi:hypothetical protein